MKKIKILIVDDQPLVRKILISLIQDMPSIGTIYEANDPYEARDILEDHEPDIMTLDLEMPRLNGLDFLKKLMPQYPMPVIMVSSFTKEGCRITVDALEAGAVDFVTKPDGNPNGMAKLKEELTEKILQYAFIDRSKLLNHTKNHQPFIAETNHKYNNNINLIAIGASTGGTNAIRHLLTNLPKQFPPIVIVQHMPSGFTKMFADRLKEEYKININEVSEDEILQNNHLYLAPGDKHIIVSKKGNHHFVQLSEIEKVNGHRPSVDVCFNSISKLNIAKETLAIILTGMGNDGAKGILELKKNGAITIGQDEESCVVYGMPKVAFDIGGITEQLSLFSIPAKLKNILNGNSSKGEL